MNKQEIAERLFNGIALDGEEILFILSNIPDDGSMGKFSAPKPKIAFDHDASNVFEACGVSQEMFSDAVDRINGWGQSKSLSKKSHVVEQIELDEEARRVALVLFLRERYGEAIAKDGPDAMERKIDDAVTKITLDGSDEGVQDKMLDILKLLSQLKGLERKSRRKKDDEDV